MYYLFNVLISNLYSAIHLRPVSRRVIMLDLELLTEFGDHSVEICTIICNDSLGDTISTDKVMLDEPRHNIIGNSSKRGSLNPLHEVINGH